MYCLLPSTCRLRSRIFGGTGVDPTPLSTIVLDCLGSDTGEGSSILDFADSDWVLAESET